MGSYGILIAEGPLGQYEIVGEVSTRDEAAEMADNFTLHRGDFAPWRFVIHRRGKGGWYTTREIL